MLYEKFVRKNVDEIDTRSFLESDQECILDVIQTKGMSLLGFLLKERSKK